MGTRVNRRRLLRCLPAAALAAGLLVAPLAARASGVVQVPVNLDVVVQRASVVVVGKSLGERQVQVQVPIAETGLAPNGRTVLEFPVRQYGVRVDRVIGADPRKLARKGAELWLTDPGDYDQGLLGEVAAAVFAARETYWASRRVDVEKAGTPLVAFVETAADRAARGKKASGLAEALWLVTSSAFEQPGKRGEVERLRAKARREAPRSPPGTPSPRR